MTIHDIVLMGNPVLLRKAEPYGPDALEGARTLAEEMIETMLAAPGIGLAAPQIGVSRRLIVFRVPPHRAGDGEEVPITVLVNPEVTPVGEAVAEDWEGCLSIPGLRGLVSRPAAIRYRGLALDGTLVEAEATGMHARVVQHEVDHLDGVLYPMRMQDLSKFGFAEALAAASAEEAA